MKPRTLGPEYGTAFKQDIGFFEKQSAKFPVVKTVAAEINPGQIGSFRDIEPGTGHVCPQILIDQAHHHIGKLQPLAPLTVSLDEALGLVCADETHARTDCPSVDASLKDGFAVLSSDIAAASPSNPVTLTVEGSLAAGDAAAHCRVKSGTTVRIMTGAPLPCGATSVLASEFAQVEGDHVTIWADAGPGRNILCKGSDIALGQVVLEQGEILGPTHLGLLAAAGLNKVTCYPRPRVAVAATGSELVWPGEPVSPGKIAASNMVTVAAELKALGISAAKVLLRDNLDNLQEQFRLLVDQADVVITCGGVLDGDKDLTLRAMEAIGMEKIDLPDGRNMIHAVERLLARARRPMRERSRKEMTLAAYKVQASEPDYRQNARMSWDSYIDD